jgi:cytoskeletal protein RodZ
MYLFFILLVSVAWAAAQQTNPGSTSGSTSQTSPTSDAGQTGSASTPPSAQGTGSASSQATTPGGSASSSAPGAAAADQQMIEGCLGGSAPNFTVIDKAGTAYKLDINQGADTTPLSKHIGEPVKVAGTVTGASASASTGSSAAGTTATASSSPTIKVMQIGRGTGTCPAGSTGGANPPTTK